MKKRTRSLSASIERFRDFLIPPFCVSCGSAVSGGLLCGHCADEALKQEARAGNYCRSCGVLLGPFPMERCPDCENHPPRYIRQFSLFDYHHPVFRELVHLAKFESCFPALEEIAKLAVRLKESFPFAPEEAIVPVPLSPLRRLERGYNQTAELLRLCGFQCEELLARRSAFWHQSDLSRSDREKRIRDQFTLKKGAATRLEGRDLWLADDISTTGATVNAISGVLLSNGAKSVSVFTFFRD